MGKGKEKLILKQRIENKENNQKHSNIESKEKQAKIHNVQKLNKEEECFKVQWKGLEVQIDRKYPFQDLLERYKGINKINQPQIIKWIILIEKTIWKITNQLRNNDESIDLKIHMRQIECEMDMSTLAQVVLIYQNQINKRLKYYGMKQIWQAKSHILLTRAVAAIIAFQSVKFNRQRRNCTLCQYRVPLAIQQLSQNFYSTNKEANKALKYLNIYYSYRKGKKKIFQLNSSNNSYQKFGREVAKETRSAKMWIQLTKKTIERQRYLLGNQSILQQSKQNKAKQDQSSLNFISSLNIQLPVLQFYYQNDPWLLAFLMNIPADILGMIKLLFLAQNPIQKMNNPQMKHDKLINLSCSAINQQLPINIYANKVGIDTLNISQNKKLSRFYIFSDNSIECKDYNQIKFCKTVHSLLNEKQQKSWFNDYGPSLILLAILFINIAFI